MKLLAVLTLAFVLSLATGFPWKHRKNEYERRRVSHRHSVKKEHKHETKHESAKARHHGSKTKAHKVYKKYGMFTAPSFALEDSSVAPQGQVGFQQVLVPVNSASFTQNTVTAPEMVSSFTAVPASQRATLATEALGDQSSAQQQIATQAIQPQQTQTVQYESPAVGTNEDNSVLKTTTQAATTDGATLQEPGATQTEVVGSPAGSFGAGSESIQSFTQQDPGKGTDEMKDLQVYNGPLPDSGQNKPQIAGMSPQEDVKIVNLGDDEKTATLQQDKPCGGCPQGAKCVNGQCQIREEDAQAAGLTGRGTASNPAGSINDIRNLETQELTSLLRDASKADTPPTAVPESPTAGAESPTAVPEGPTAVAENPTGSPITTQFHSQSQEQLQDKTHSSAQQQKIESAPQTALAKPASPHVQVAQMPGTVVQPRFTGEQLKELRDFARMYKMYQFIRKMEERLNDPDCAPVCRKQCRNFCPKKCCRGQKVNTSVVSHLMQTADKIKGTGNKAVKQHTGMEDNGGENEDSEEQEEKKMDKETAGKKHILIRIVKNDELDKPRAHIAH